MRLVRLRHGIPDATAALSAFKASAPGAPRAFGAFKAIALDSAGALGAFKATHQAHLVRLGRLVRLVHLVRLRQAHLMRLVCLVSFFFFARIFAVSSRVSAIAANCHPFSWPEYTRTAGLLLASQCALDAKTSGCAWTLLLQNSPCQSAYSQLV